MSEVHLLEREQRLPAAPDAAFAFFADPLNLERITPPLLRFRVVTPPPGAMGTGTLIRYRLRVHGVPLSWLTAIEEWAPPHRFADVQLRGPYALWHHTHTFERDGEETIMRDAVRYRIGFGPLGALANSLLVRRDLERIFDYRAALVPALVSEAASLGA